MLIFNNYYILYLKNFIFLPEIFLSISILILILYKVFFIEKFSQFYTFIFLVYSGFCLSITIFLVIVTGNSAFCYGYFCINYKISFIQITILIISLFCLVLFRRSLTKSRTNCLSYFILYLSTVLVCLITLMVDITNTIFLFLLLEFVTLCFYILSSFNFNNFGFLVFRFIPWRKLLNISVAASFIGLFFLQGYIYLNTLDLNEVLDCYLSYIFVLKKQEYFLISGIILISISLLLKIVVFHSPTSFIYYKKTPLITVIYMHLVPKIFYFYFFSELVLSNSYFIYYGYYIHLVVLCAGLVCLIISIGMRRLFLKHFLEYLSLVNSGYLLLCFTPLNLNSFIFCIYFLWFYVAILFIYGGICLFFDDLNYPGLRVSFDTILIDIGKKKDYYSIIILTLIFFLCGMPPTRKDFPSSRGIPFSGFIPQLLLIQSLLFGEMYLILFFLIIFNLILFSFFFWTIIPFWQKNYKTNSFLVLPKYFNPLLNEFIIVCLVLFLLILQFDSFLFIKKYIQAFSN